ncbi:MAG: ATP-binding protein [Candidatus Margulisbacteria bacterium]|nr:ATP-binding protein [Candidatus Margulisiibacteriota bacterium]
MKYLARRYVIGIFVLLFLSFFVSCCIFQTSIGKYRDNVLKAELVQAQEVQVKQNLQTSLLSASSGVVTYMLISLMAVHLFVALVLIMVLYKISRKNIEPLEELSEAMDNFSFVYSEEFPRFNFEGRKEIVNLVRSFNQLRQKVLETVSDIKFVSKYKQDFMTNVTHELKTPLTSILGYIETLDAGAIDDPEHNKKFVEAIKRNVERLSALVADILSLSKIENRQSVKQKINVLDVFQLVTKDYDLYNRKNVTIVISYKKVSMLADSDELYSAFSNYITNALKFSPDGDIRIKMHKKENQLFFSVRDSGPGIEAEHIPRIFERFYRIDKGRSRKDGGTGLGLAIVKNVVEKYGGSIGVTSFPGKGSDFYFYLPLENYEE